MPSTGFTLTFDSTWNNLMNFFNSHFMNRIEWMEWVYTQSVWCVKALKLVEISVKRIQSTNHGLQALTWIDIPTSSNWLFVWNIQNRFTGMKIWRSRKIYRFFIWFLAKSSFIKVREFFHEFMFSIECPRLQVIKFIEIPNLVIFWNFWPKTLFSKEFSSL